MAVDHSAGVRKVKIPPALLAHLLDKLLVLLVERIWHRQCSACRDPGDVCGGFFVNIDHGMRKMPQRFGVAPVHRQATELRFCHALKARTRDESLWFNGLENRVLSPHGNPVD